MNTVEPIRDFDLILDMQDYLYEKKNKRDYLIFMFGIYSGLRISDILPLKVRDVRSATHLYVEEQKTGKKKRVVINDELKRAIKEYVADKKDWEYLFRRNGKNNKPITRQRVWQILNETAKQFDYIHPIGCHSMRKTFGYWMYQRDKDAAALMDIFNHSDISITKRYIGVTQDSNEDKMRRLSFKSRRKYKGE